MMFSALRVPNTFRSNTRRHTFDGVTSLMVLLARLGSANTRLQLGLTLNMDPRLVSHIAATMVEWLHTTHGQRVSKGSSRRGVLHMPRETGGERDCKAAQS